MPLDTLRPVALGAAAGGFVNGLAGFGTALSALGFFLGVMDPVEAVAVIVVPSVLTGLQGVWVVRRTLAARSRRLMRFPPPGLAGIPSDCWRSGRSSRRR